MRISLAFAIKTALLFGQPDALGQATAYAAAQLALLAAAFRWGYRRAQADQQAKSKQDILDKTQARLDRLESRSRSRFFMRRR